MRKGWKTIGICRQRGARTLVADIPVAPCPHCLGYELVVSDVAVEGTAPAQYPNAVHCGNCGASGPWGTTELLAVKYWNDTMNVETDQNVAWTALPDLNAAPVTGETEEHIPF